jgi:hypothetical protein
VRSGSQRDVGPAVDQNPAIGSARKSQSLAYQGEQHTVGQILLADLNEIDTLPDISTYAGDEGGPVQALAVGDVVQKRPFSGEAFLPSIVL